MSATRRVRSRVRRLAGFGAVGGLLLVIAACGESTGPTLTPSSVHVLLVGGGADSPFDEVTVQVGATLSLRAEVRDAAGKEVEGESVEWLSDAPGVATVSGNGVVTAQGLGTAHIIARHRVGADTARVNVAAPLTGVFGCDQSQELRLERGQVHTTTADRAVLLCLPGGVAGAEYTYIAVNAAQSAGSMLEVLVEAKGVTSQVVGPPRPSIALFGSGSLRVRDEFFHQWIRERTSRALEPRLRAHVASRALSPAPALAASVGETISLNVSTAGDPCTNVEMRTGRVRAISAHAIVVADTLNPKVGAFTTADYEQLARQFDDLAWPVVTENFGEPTDIDGNGHVIIFFTRAVNKLPGNSGPNRGSYIGGFFFNRDLFQKSGERGCEASNATEMFYMLVPDATSEEDGFTRNFVMRSASTVLTHEFQHLVNDSRRLYVNESPVWEETWLNEGLSHIAEELAFYRVAGLAPRSNLDRQDFFGSTQARDAFGIYQIDNYDRFTTYLRSVEFSSVIGADLLSTRGATWAFLRYAADRHGGGPALWRTLVRDTRTAGLPNLRAALGAEPLDWITDWATALYVDDAGLTIDPRYLMPSWNFRDLAPVARELWPRVRSEVRYPLRTQTMIEEIEVLPLSLQGGGAAYLRAGVRPGERAAVRTRVGNLPGPSRLRITIVRTK